MATTSAMGSSERAIPKKTPGVYEVDVYSAISAKVDSPYHKDIISNKYKLEDHETVMLTEECSARIQNKLPPKLKDPWSFTVPCEIGELYFDKALYDLGATDFLILDMEEDKDVPLILGRPFLATGRALIDVQRGQLILKLEEEHISFNVSKAMKLPAEFDSYYQVDIISDSC
ncbi:uncharacterized protein LOC111379777 [Olea europaea var. sylvestris]|uniref:uncharacterized protein LOC111379777 n=1 Tax=Olea europaea var. sylvestris TaxID=158386 RepID=UPI000C1D07F3|nr:uncharacterized protein LOC111379777 [Olea europaea var. sylvestris]